MEIDSRSVPWEACQTLNGSWSYFRDSQNDKSWIARVLSVIVILVADNISIRNDDQDYEGAA
jgi:hypothetical protein